MMNFQDIPQNIKNSLFSERIDKTLDEIRSTAGITSSSTLSQVYYELITKEIPAHYFVETLADEGKIGKKIAASIAKAVKERILESERYPLFRWGIDISEIKVSDAEDVEKLGLKEEVEEGEGKTISLESFEEPSIETIPIIKSDQIPAGTPEPAPASEKTPSPFILQEKPKEAGASVGIGARSIPSLSFGFFKPKRASEPALSKTVKAEIQTPAETKRVVHYTENRSTLSPFEQGGEFLKTEEIATPIVSPLTPSPMSAAATTNEGVEAKTPEKPKEESGPTIEGNIIDLRSQ